MTLDLVIAKRNESQEEHHDHSKPMLEGWTFRVEKAQHKGHGFAVFPGAYVYNVEQPAAMTTVLVRLNHHETKLSQHAEMLREIMAELEVCKNQLRVLTRPGEPIEKAFGSLADKWHEETDALSSPTKITSNEAYLKIIALGQAAIPLILRDLQERGGDWYLALRVLTDANPVRPEHEGYTTRMDAAWLNWGREHGYIL